VHSEYEQKKTFATTHNALKQISNFWNVKFMLRQC
jgi:hypothetical protein